MVSAPQTERRDRLERARLYLVCAPARTAPAQGLELPDLLRAAVAGGVDIVQLREKQLGDDELAAVALALPRRLCERLGALLIVNDRPGGGARGGRRRRARGTGRPAGGGGPRDRRPGRCWSASPRTAPGRSTRSTRRSSTTSAWARCTRRRPSRAARRSGSSSCATRPPTRPCRSSRSAASTRATSARCSTRAPSACACCARSPAPREPEAAARELCGDRSTGAPAAEADS